MIFLNQNKITIQNYKRILKVSEQEIIFMKNKSSFFIYGNNLMITYYDSDEFIIQGKIDKIEIFDN